jgi:hypothetical protein
VAAVSTAHFQHIAKAGGGDHAKLGALAFQKRIGANRGAMHHRRHAGRAAQGAQASKETACLITALAWYFRGLKAAR